MNTATALQPVATSDRHANPLRPNRLDDVIGQDRAKRLMRRMIDHARHTGRPLDHVLLVGAAGTGKSTFSHVLAHELNVRVYEVQAPISYDTLAELRTTMRDGDLLRIEEIHLQAIQERRGKAAATQPEVLFALMEDRVLQTPEGVLPYPAITIVGTTTDEGMLPDAFISRFPLRPHLEPYTIPDMMRIAEANADALGLRLDGNAAEYFALASRGVPRQVNTYVRNAEVLSDNGFVSDDLAYEVIRELNNTTLDGLNADMQAMLVKMYTLGRQETKDGDVKYQMSVSNVATLLGKSRDAKAIQLRVEPYLIDRGYVQVAQRGRILTDAGVARARELVELGY